METYAGTRAAAAEITTALADGRGRALRREAGDAGRHDLGPALAAALAHQSRRLPRFRWGRRGQPVVRHLPGGRLSASGRRRDRRAFWPSVPLRRLSPASSLIPCSGSSDCTSGGCTASSTRLNASGMRSARRPALSPVIPTWHACWTSSTCSAAPTGSREHEAYELCLARQPFGCVVSAAAPNAAKRI